MSRQLASPATIAILAALLGYTWAQRPSAGADAAAPDNGFPVAVVDLAKVFNGYQKLAERREDHQREVQKVEETAKSRFVELNRLKEELKKFKEGSADQKQA